MKLVEPRVSLIARPSIDWTRIDEYLTRVGGTAWSDRMLEDNFDPNTGEPGTKDAQAIVEFAGRMCYRSWDVGLNPNVTKVRQDSEAYIENLLRSEHGSVLEHAQFTFLLEDVSRVFTHELVRHRVGVAISQESMRYVRLEDVPIWFPPELAEDPEFMNRAKNICHLFEVFMQRMTEHYKLDDPSTNFERKKAITSALRRLAPSGHATCMTWSANIRTLRHTILMRTAPGAEVEMRDVFHLVGMIIKEECPLLFMDMKPTTVVQNGVTYENVWVRS